MSMRSGQVDSPAVNRRTSRWLVLVLLACWFSGTFVRVFVTTEDVPQEMLHTVSQQWADERRCAECHEQAESFWKTGHARTLTKVTDEASREALLVVSHELQRQGIPLRMEFDDDRVIVTHQLQNTAAQQAVLNYCFGSGQHAQTWVGTLPDSQGATEILEYRWSKYHLHDEVALTPGQPEHPPPSYFAQLGLLNDAPKARQCFACHTSALPDDDGKIDFAHAQLGVTCQRCHGPRQQHLATDGEFVDDFWQTATQMESIHRCGECHRRADEQLPHEIHENNVSLVRFQPVGLVQSRCFQHSEMTCLSCHDPHRTLEEQDSLGLWQCFQCHAGEDQQSTDCRSGHFDGCIDCHMPKVRMDAPLEFTDHWIRVRFDPQ